MELGKVLQRARQNFKDSEGNVKPMSQGDLAKLVNQHSKVIQECQSSLYSPSMLGFEADIDPYPLQTRT